jgi:hypothetical protein
MLLLISFHQSSTHRIAAKSYWHGRTLAVLAAALVVGFWLAIGSVSGSSGTMVGGIGGHGIESGFKLAGILEILPTLAIRRL